MATELNPLHLARAGGPKGIDLTPNDFEAMDLALALVPELRISALAVRLARQSGSEYPITGPEGLVRLLSGEARLSIGGHEIDANSIQRFFVSGDFPIENEVELASTVYVALNRCRYREQLQRAIEQLDAGLDLPVGTRR